MDDWIPLALHRDSIARIKPGDPIPDFLPRPGERIIFYVHNKHGWRHSPRPPIMLIGRLDSGRGLQPPSVRTEKQGLLDFYGQYELLEIAYWMPAPKPPRETGNSSS